MKVGDYVRLKNGYIDKIEELKLQTKYTKYNKLLFEHKAVECLFSDEDLKQLKSSPNIMDLILPMDLMYIDISPDNCGGIVVPRIPETYCELNQIINEIKLGNYILKGIVTKEQLMENMYKVESKVN